MSDATEGQVAVADTSAMDVFAELDTRAKASEGVEIEIFKPDGETSGIFIKVLGQDSDAYTKLKEKQDRARVRLISKGGRGAVDGIYDNSKTYEMELVVACCVSWRHTNGKAMPFRIGEEDENQTRKFFERYPVVYDQVRVGISDRANFTKVPAKN
jgi:hypothetical protein